MTDIVEPQRQLSAERLCAELRGVVVLNVATVTNRGEPRLSAVDGHFLHGHWYFSTAGSAVKAGHLMRRPAISVGYTPRDGYGVWAHGVAVRLAGDAAAAIDRYLSTLYGQPLSALADEIAIYRVDAHWMVGFAMTEPEMAQFEATLPERDARIPAALAALG
ncbi:pyridoxamine 5'-phosphate oxidase [Antricoccus suffuscus]|uniref:Pyridoxamine 5'-phosphate oxidase n=1 Tax=Antricoccus suffuscus TaxID=1629062 RepID=A0A2T1A535_9ACTN|nr:pyridoxamine 5'-phosphate oxidase [Antricoccus suffuscus]